jgi:hypothetical protein
MAVMQMRAMPTRHAGTGFGRRHVVRLAGGLIGALVASLIAAPAAPQDARWATFSRADLGLTLRRPADLYEVEPEAPSSDVRAEVEWGPKDHAWSILITSQKLKAGQTLATLLAEEKSQNPNAEAALVKIGDSVEAARIVARDEDTLSHLVLLLDRSGAKLIAIELAINLTEDDAGKSMDALRISYNGTLALFERMLETLRIAKN